jgi:hypothetical protein
MKTLRAGDWVEVRTPEEILATLDKEGCLDSLPFMPEMMQYCGKTFPISKSAHKSCNTLGGGGIRRMADAVHLERLRCDGTSHGGCQAACLLFWKTAWLKPVAAPDTGQARADAPRQVTGPSAGRACSFETLVHATRAMGPEGAGTGECFRCQATEHRRATSKALWWDPRLYVMDLITKNVRPWDLLRYALLAGLNVVLRLAGQRTHPNIRGLAGARTPTADLHLQPGEWVRVRSKIEIMHTLNEASRNRGLVFDVEMLPFCGRAFRVLRRVERLIDERSGWMIQPRMACIILEGATCSGCYSRDRLFCPRSIYPYWHEIWLERVHPVDRPSGRTDAANASG